MARSTPAGSTGFPSPAADYYEERLSLDEYLIEHREATFFVRVAGHSMTGFGIHDGDLLVVDRALDPADRSVVRSSEANVIGVKMGVPWFQIRELGYVADRAKIRPAIDKVIGEYG